MTDNVLRDVECLPPGRVVGHLWLAVVAASKIMEVDEVLEYVRGVLGLSATEAQSEGSER